MDKNELDTRLTGGNELPQNLDAEASVLAAAILSEKVLPEVTSMLKPDDFYKPAHRVVFAAICELYKRDIPVDQVSLADYLEQSNQLQLVGGKSFVLDLANNSFALVNWANHANIVKRCSVLRSIIAASTDITALAFNAPPEDIESIIEQSEGMLLSVTNREVASASRPLGDFVSQAFDEIREIATSDRHIYGVQTGFTQLDDILLGLRPGTLTVLGARPGVGKTSFALSLALNAAKKGASVVFFSLEMSGTEIATRLLCSESGISNEDVRAGNIDDALWAPMIEACERLSSLDITIDDTAGTNVVEIRTKARRMLEGKENGLVIVDYLQLITPADPRQTDRNVQVGEMSRSLKVLAKDLQVPVIALSQLNRDLERRPDKRPMLADLRDSGSIEQDADVVLFLDRSLTEDEAADSTHDRPPLGTARVIVAKNRAGRSGVDVLLSFIANRTLFMNYSGAQE
ncbi:MAG: replicative DNA helicase [Coriobacteriales bacterium]